MRQSNWIFLVTLKISCRVYVYIYTLIKEISERSAKYTNGINCKPMKKHQIYCLIGVWKFVNLAAELNFDWLKINKFFKNYFISSLKIFIFTKL